MKGALVLVPVRWMNAAWKQPLAHVRSLASPLGSLVGVALLRRPRKLAPVPVPVLVAPAFARPRPVVRNHPHCLLP